MKIDKLVEKRQYIKQSKFYNQTLINKIKCSVKKLTISPIAHVDYCQTNQIST